MIGWRARLGFLVPPGNPTVEPEMMALVPVGVSLHFPRRARNTNSGNPLLARDGPDAIRVAHNTVHHAAATPSFIELPVLADKNLGFDTTATP